MREIIATRYPCKYVWLIFLHLSLVSSHSCEDLVTCSECLRSVSGCTWCITNTTAQCASDSLLMELNCSLEINPHSRLVDAGYQTLGELNQISLDRVTLKLRVGEPLTFNFTVKPSDNYPLDLYILMDISNTFHDDLMQVKMLAPSLVESLNNLTNDSLIGFGTFADKQSPPFVSRRQLDLLFDDLSGDPSCRRNEECSLPVAYEHVSNLTNLSDSFNDAIQQIIISTSADGPEGTLDAMMQAAVCTDLIGWRKKSRKLLLVMTDDEVHIAGDGRMAGIIKRNDEQCHTEYNEQHNKRFLYSTSTEQDYPSFEQLRLVLRRNGIVPIFAIPTTYKLADVESHFASIKNLLNGYLAVSSSSSANLINVIADAYDDIISQVSLDFKSLNFLQTSVQFTCPPSNNISTERCTDIEEDEEVQVNMTLTLTECVTDIHGDGYPLEVIVPGFDKFTIILKGECSCDCDNMTQTNVTKCVNGELSCGKCYCNTGWKGDNCNCSSMACPSFNGQVCGGHGTCDGCGNCVCNTIDCPIGGVSQPVIFGDACQCSNYDCESGLNGLVCSGRGDCLCDGAVYSCDCSEPYYGDMCQCSTYYCINPEYTNNGVCSGHGSCDTPCQRQGKGCKCDDNYIGDYCQTLRIESIRDECGSGNDGCIKCYGEAAEENKEAACDSCEGYSALYMTQSSDYEIPGTIDGSTQECSLSTAECNYVYFVGSGLNGTGLVYAVEPRSCLLLPIWSIVVIVIMGLLIAVVLVLIAIKVVIMWLDHLDYRSFMYKAIQSGSSSVGAVTQNPIYENLDEILYVSSTLKDRLQ